MADQPRTPQGWAWNYLVTRLEAVTKSLESPENLPRITTFAELKEGKLFIRFPWFRVENGELVFKNTELYRKIRPVRYVDGPRGDYGAMQVMTSSLHEIPDDEPVVIIR